MIAPQRLEIGEIYCEKTTKRPLRGVVTKGTISYVCIIDVLLDNVDPCLEPVQHADVGHCHHWHDMGLHQVEVSNIFINKCITLDAQFDTLIVTCIA